ncbi:MAG: hypothetical protein HON90_14735 [Halobacteriovoraceae bacterium]|jgi:hypothetical protein|nr:hypothetical protein [Halobacteriovoraceae bacterium]
MLKRLNYYITFIFGSHYYYLILGLVALTIYYPIIIKDHLFDIDYDLVIGPLRNVNTISDYFKVFTSKDLFDVQPIRDLSLLIDIQLEKIFNHQFFGISSLILWLGTILTLEKILNFYTLKINSRLICLIAFSHPLMTWVLGWPTARKHILSCFFITLATLYTIKMLRKNGKESFYIFLFCLLSLLSQPITGLGIVIFFLYTYEHLKQRKELLELLGLLSVTFLLIIGLNYFYYSYLYPDYTGTHKLAPVDTSSILVQFLAFSRSISQILIPLKFAQTYTVESLLSFIGAPLLAILSYYSYIKVGIKKTSFFILFIFYPLFLILLNPTNIFVSDTYLIVSIINFAIIAGYFLKKTSTRFLRTSLFVVFFLVYSKSCIEIKNSTTSLNFFQVSFEREPNCKNAHAYANELLKKNAVVLFMNISGQALKNKCAMGGKIPSAIMNQVYAFRIVLDESFTQEYKLSSLKKIYYITPETLFLMAIFLADKDPKESRRLFEENKILVHRDMKKILNATSKKYCKNSQLCKNYTL